MRKGVKAMNFVVGLIVSLMILMIVLPIALEFIFGVKDAASGCSTMASVIADLFGGAVNLC